MRADHSHTVCVCFLYIFSKKQLIIYIFQVILSYVQSYIGEQPRDILLGASDEVLISMKQSSGKKEKLDEIKELLGDVTEDRFVSK